MVFVASFRIFPESAFHGHGRFDDHLIHPFPHGFDGGESSADGVGAAGARADAGHAGYGSFPQGRVNGSSDQVTLTITGGGISSGNTGTTSGNTNGVQSIYIARLKNPWTIEGSRTRISTPDHPWEKVGDLDPRDQIIPMPHVDVNEGPEVLEHDGRIFLTYSASGCWTNYYELGLLSARADADLLDARSWTKSDQPVFRQDPAAHAYGTGHNGFFTSPDGKENWIIYHANPEINQGCGDLRSPRAQPFTWRPDGTPDFGKPVPLGQPIAAPGGEQ